MTPIENVSDGDLLIGMNNGVVHLLCNNGKYIHCGKQYTNGHNPIAVYNLEVYKKHTYLVGSEGVIVHNDCVADINENPLLKQDIIRTRFALKELDKLDTNDSDFISKETEIAANAIPSAKPLSHALIKDGHDGAARLFDDQAMVHTVAYGHDSTVTFSDYKDSFIKSINDTEKILRDPNFIKDRIELYGDIVMHRQALREQGTEQALLVLGAAKARLSNAQKWDDVLFSHLPSTA